MHTLLRALRARNNGAADYHPPVAWRFAPATTGRRITIRRLLGASRRTTSG